MLDLKLSLRRDGDDCLWESVFFLCVCAVYCCLDTEFSILINDASL